MISPKKNLKHYSKNTKFENIKFVTHANIRFVTKLLPSKNSLHRGKRIKKKYFHKMNRINYKFQFEIFSIFFSGSFKLIIAFKNIKIKWFVDFEKVLFFVLCLIYVIWTNEPNVHRRTKREVVDCRAMSVSNNVYFCSKNHKIKIFVIVAHVVQFKCQ